jgi:molecular chaperone GrpE
MDNLEKAISHSHNENSLDALREGVELTLKGLRDTLVKAGMEQVKAEGEAFDPCFHAAVSEQEDNSVEAGMILHELQKGYILNQRLIRPAMVVVSKGKPGNATNHDSTSGRACEKY